jgi:hypothetical protein
MLRGEILQIVKISLAICRRTGEAWDRELNAVHCTHSRAQRRSVAMTGIIGAGQMYKKNSMV